MRCIHPMIRSRTPNSNPLSRVSRDAYASPRRRRRSSGVGRRCTVRFRSVTVSGGPVIRLAEISARRMPEDWDGEMDVAIVHARYTPAAAPAHWTEQTTLGSAPDGSIASPLPSPRCASYCCRISATRSSSDLSSAETDAPTVHSNGTRWRRTTHMGSTFRRSASEKTVSACGRPATASPRLLRKALPLSTARASA